MAETQKFKTALETATYPNSRTIEVDNGSIIYSVIGEPNPAKHPIIWVSGAEQGRINSLDAARLLASQGHRQVLIYEQPVYNPDVPAGFKQDPQHAVDFLAGAVLAAAEDAGFVGEGKVADAIGHSLGGIVLERVRQLAEERGFNSLDQDAGAKLALVAPTGSNRRENLVKIGGRWAGYSVKSIIEGKTLDPGGAKGRALQENTKADFSKAVGEVKAMAEKRIDYGKFGEALVLIYPEDRMFPENGPARRYRARGPLKKPIKRGFVSHSLAEGYPLHFATPIGPEQVATKGMKRWLTKTALRTEGRREYVKSYRGAGHNDPTDNPKRTVRSLLQYLDS